MRNRRKSVKSETRQHIDNAAADIQVTTPEVTTPEVTTPEVTTPEVTTPEVTTPEVTTPPDTGDDMSWLDTLTPVEDSPPATQDVPPVEVSTPTEEGDGTELQQQQLADLYAGLEFVEEEQAQEVHDKLIAPEVAALNAEIHQIKQHQQNQQQQQLVDVLNVANGKIRNKYPQADLMLKSKEFRDSVNATGNKYASETPYDILSRAYYAGDSDFVLEHLDRFVESRGKPKPIIGVEPQQGSGGNSEVVREVEKVPMTWDEYASKREAIRTAPRNTLPPNALANLVKEFEDSQKK